MGAVLAAAAFARFLFELDPNTLRLSLQSAAMGAVLVSAAFARFLFNARLVRRNLTSVSHSIPQPWARSLLPLLLRGSYSNQILSVRTSPASLAPVRCYIPEFGTVCGLLLD